MNVIKIFKIINFEIKREYRKEIWGLIDVPLCKWERIQLSLKID
jgi:hypothetical protein